VSNWLFRCNKVIEGGYVPISYYDILAPNENFRGRSYGEWAAEWWKWLLGSKDPDYSQGDPMLFLRGAFDYEQIGGQRRPKRKPHLDKTEDKKIEISEGTPIFFPVIQAEFNEGDLESDDRDGKINIEEKMRYLARRENDESGPMGATIQIGTEGPKTKIVDDLKRYRAESPLFKLVVSNESIIADKLDVAQKAGTFDAVADGYWILIRSLPPSNEPYRIHFEAVGRDNYYNSATYDIIVKPKQTSRVEDKSDILVTGNSLYPK
jgi:hypothetical protein